MAGDKPPISYFLEHRLLLPAARSCVRAARMEGAARWKVTEVGGRAWDGLLFVDVADEGGGGVDEPDGVRVLSIVENLLYPPYLYDFTCIHHPYPIGYFGDY